MTATGLVPPAPGITQVVSGTIGTPVQAGLNIVTPGVNIASIIPDVLVNGSFSGIWNTTATNTGALTASTVVNTPLVNATAVQTLGIAATRGDFTTLGAPLPTGPVSYNAAYFAPLAVPSIAIPTVPLLVPPAISDPTPPIFGKASGWAYPVGNGDEFYSSILTSPFSFITDIIPGLDTGGYGITRAQMPEPPSKSMMCYNGGYYPRGYSVGIFNSSIEDSE